MATAAGVGRPGGRRRPAWRSGSSVKSAALRSRSAVSRISFIGSSSALFTSSWKLLPIFFSSAYVRPARRSASGSFSGPEHHQRQQQDHDDLAAGQVEHAAKSTVLPSSGAVQQRLPSLLDRPIAFAHRGARAHARENTIEAFALGLRLGATGLESDVWLTADGVPVLDHDGVVQARPAPAGRSATLARADLPAHIPTLAELLGAVRHATTTCRSTSRAPTPARP